MLERGHKDVSLLHSSPGVLTCSLPPPPKLGTGEEAWDRGTQCKRQAEVSLSLVTNLGQGRGEGMKMPSLRTTVLVLKTLRGPRD